MNSETAKEIARDARLLLDALDTGFPHKKWDLVMAAMPAIVTGHQMDDAQLADKNRAVKERIGFTEEQVRKAVTGRAKQSGYGDESAGRFTGDVIKRLREPETVPEPVEGGVYRSPGGILHRRSQGRWLMFGLTAKLTDDELGYPVEKMERVL